jgi:tetratricopeptide (TPR) repeat protein
MKAELALPMTTLFPVIIAATDATLFLFVGGIALLAGLAVGLWLVFGSGPRRSRGHRRARRLLEQGQWREGLTLAEALLGKSTHSAYWEGRLRNLVGECHYQASRIDMEQHRYEDAFQHALLSAQYLAIDEADARQTIAQAMLADVRRMFAAATGIGDNEQVLKLVARLLALDAPCAEALFWQGLCQVRAGRLDVALTSFKAAHEQTGKIFVDPPFYLGLLLLRENKPHDALRYLAEANRLESGCPFIAWQLGVALVAAGSDCHMAARALQRAIARFEHYRTMTRIPTKPKEGSAPPERLSPADALQRAWSESLSETQSFVRHLVLKYPYHCPFLGADLTTMIRQAQESLGQALYRAGNYQAAADQYGKLLQEMPPTVGLLRGLGLALVRLERYDDAFKQLRIAYDQEDPKDPQTAGYLALCGALGKPKQPEDRPRNIAWALKLLARFEIRGDEEWARLCNAVFAEARAVGVPQTREDQRRLCEVLASVNAADAGAAAAFDHLALTHPDALLPDFAFLYCRAAQAHGFTGQRDFDLFALAFRHVASMRALFANREWDFSEVEYTYLERFAATSPGRFPEILGAEYAAQGERFLLARSQTLEQAGRDDAALVSAQVLHALAPRRGAVHDRLARLYYRRGELERAANYLADWSRLEPDNAVPLLRLAVVEQRRHDPLSCGTALARALELSHEPEQGRVALFAARLLLSCCLDTECQTKPEWSRIESFLRECLARDADDLQALSLLAVVRSLANDRAGLAALAPALNRPGVREAHFHFLAAICWLATEDDERAIEAARRVLDDAGLGTEAQFLLGWACWHRKDTAAAQAAWWKVAASARSPSVDHARALLAHIDFACGAYSEALGWWKQIAPAQRAAWRLDAPLADTAFLTGLLAHEAGNDELAALRFREARDLGCRDDRLAALLPVALVKAAQRLLRAEDDQNQQQKKALVTDADMADIPVAILA